MHLRCIFERSLKLDPNNIDALNNLAYIIAEQGGDIDQALVYATRALGLSNDPGIADTLGWVYIKKGQTEKAILTLIEIINLYPDHTSMSAFQYHLGIAYAQRGDKVAARNALNAALQSKPGESEKIEIQALLKKLN